jgi:hypothetical protein
MGKRLPVQREVQFPTPQPHALLTLGFGEQRNRNSDQTALESSVTVIKHVLCIGGDSEALSISTLRLIGHSRFHRGENASFANPLCHRNGAIVVRSIVFVDCLRSGVAADTKKR